MNCRTQQIIFVLYLKFELGRMIGVINGEEVATNRILPEQQFCFDPVLFPQEAPLLYYRFLIFGGALLLFSQVV